MVHTVNEIPSEQCTGCGACSQACPQQCIQMHPDREGFLAPSVDENLCIACGLCWRVCPRNREVPQNTPLECYASKHKDKGIVKQSSSGGMFTLLAEEILRRNGAVIGCILEPNENGRLAAVHRKTETLEGLAAMRGSKYVQSDTAQTYAQTKACLEQGQWVLYTGTPCQIGGLSAFLGRDYGKLVTVDLVCHGVPSPLLFDKNIACIEERNQGKLTQYRFRSKQKGWGYYYSYTCTDRKGKQRTSGGAKDRCGYYRAFAAGETYREVCYSCRYARPERVSDLTLGDYFGIDLQYPAFSSLDGVSAVLVNTALGKNLLDAVWDRAQWLQVTLDEVVQYSHNLKQPSLRPKNRDIAYQNIHKDPASVFEDHPYRVGLKGKLMAAAKEMMPRWMIRRLKMMVFRANAN